ncbi:MAG: 3-deoxy-D-manno-octulosonic acid transferase [Rhodobacteraceae bacterium]|nr:3-deoxy-D-manno-octulosonic acid transferase [Paracoccaceae bacterium]
MGRSLGLALYLMSAGRGGGRGVPPDWPARPPGPLLWVAAGGEASLRAAPALGRELARLRPDLTLLVTASGKGAEGAAPATGAAEPTAAAGGAAGPAGAAGRMILRLPAPADRLAAARAFLQHWRPDVAVLSEGDLPPALIHAAHARGLPLFLVNGRVPFMPANGWRSAPGLMASVLGRFRAILMTDARGLRYARRAGAPEAAVEVAGWLDEAAAPPAVTEAERAALAGLVGSRPLWLAAGIPEAEEEAVLAAHRTALRTLHRLLLILVPADPARGPAVAGRAAALFEGRVALRSADGYPAELDAVYVADTEGEFGLWLRLAPMAFIGGTLAGDGPTLSPAAAALLGSAILHGGAGGAEAGLLGRLDAAGGAEAVADARDLAAAIAALGAPDRAAARALAAWGVVTAGAEVTARVARLIAAALPAPAPAASSVPAAAPAAAAAATGAPP